jgi:hypothetical protein
MFTIATGSQHGIYVMSITQHLGQACLTHQLLLATHLWEHEVVPAHVTVSDPRG